MARPGVNIVRTVTLREAYCERYGVPPAKFDEAVLWRCIFPHARPLARLLWLLRRGYFAPDLDLIAAAAHCATPHALRQEVETVRYEQPLRGFWRRLLRVRVSGRRLIDLGAELLAWAPRAPLKARRDPADGS